MNTDFAQVEADREQVNLTRFSLFFPEKRDFFLEGAETFVFASTGNDYNGSATNQSDLRLFHSRNIGIDRGIRVPIKAGARINGKAGKYTLGLMSIQTEEKYDSIGDRTIESTNNSVIRVKRNIFQRSSVGFMILNKHTNSDEFNRTIGFDSNIYLNSKLSLYAAGASTFGPDTPHDPNSLALYVDPNKNNLAGNIGANYISDLWNYKVSYLRIDRTFNPELGFIRRTDIRKTSGKIAYSPRIKRWESIRKFNYTISSSYQTDSNGRVLNKSAFADFFISFNSSTSVVGGQIKRNFEFLDGDWGIRNGITIKEGEYSTVSGHFGYISGRDNALQYNIRATGGQYYTGNKKGISLDVKLIIPKIRWENNFKYDNIDLPNGKFHTNILTSRLTYAFSPVMYIKGYFQWFGDKLSPALDGRDRVSANILFRYTYSPLSDFYLVFNRQELRGAGNNVVQNNTVIAKFTYFLRK